MKSLYLVVAKYMLPHAFMSFLFVFVYLFTCLLPVSGWLKDEDHELIRRVSLRIEDVTGLTMDTAEELQVCTGKIFTLLKKGRSI